MTLKRDAQLPLYQQLANEIKAQIASGELRQNEQLMTEMELSRTFGVSRITVRKALELLVEEDILSKRQGVGEGAALLLQRDVSYDENGQAVYRSKSVINADRYTCTVTMQA